MPSTQIPATGAIASSVLNTAQGKSSNTSIPISGVRNGVFTNVNKTGTTSYSDFRGQSYLVNPPSANLTHQFQAKNYGGSGDWINAISATNQNMTVYINGTGSYTGPFAFTSSGTGSYFSAPNHTNPYQYQYTANLDWTNTPKTTLTVATCCAIDGKCSLGSGTTDRIFDTLWQDKGGQGLPNPALYYTTSGTIQAQTQTSGGWVSYDTGYSPTFGTWFTVVWSYNMITGRTRCWINGVRKIDQTPGLNNTAQIITQGRFGKPTDGSAGDLWGKLASVLIYNAETTTDTNAQTMHNYFATSTGLVSTV